MGYCGKFKNAHSAVKTMKNIQFTIRRYAYAICGAFDALFRRRAMVTVLCYHDIASDDWRFSTDRDAFIKQIDFLKKSYTFIGLSDLLDYLQSKKQITSPSIVLTFDDGYKGVLGIVPYLEKSGIKPTMFLIASARKRDTHALATDRAILTNNEIKQLIAAGWEIGCHSRTHRDFINLTSNEITYEVVKAKKILEENLHMNIDYFSYPKGKYNADIVSKVKDAGYTLAVTMNDGTITNTCDYFQIPRVGVDRSHTFLEFAATIRPTTVLFRRLIRKLPFTENI